MGDYDILWKGMLEDVFADVVRFIFPSADEELDLEHGITFLDKELAELYPEPGKQIDSRVVDKLVRVSRRDGNEQWLLLHLEVQGWNDPKFAERMFRYYYRILDKFKKPAAAVAIFTGKDGQRMPDRFEARFLGTKVIYRYNTIYTQDYADEELMKSDNFFAMVLLVAKLEIVKRIRDPAEFDEALLEQKTLLFKYFEEKRRIDENKVNVIQTFLHNYMSFKNPEINDIFMERIDQISGKTNTMGLLEQLAEIKAEKAREQQKANDDHRVVANLISKTEFSSSMIASIADVSVEFVEAIRKELQSK